MKNLLILMAGLCWLVCFPAQLPGQKVQRGQAPAGGQTMHSPRSNGAWSYTAD